MLYFPRPYPDEVIGSLLVRACLHTGLPKKRLIAELTHGRREYGSFILSPLLPELGRATGVDPEALLVQHTLFPYVAAFMQEPDAARIRDALLSIRHGHVRSVAACTQSATQGVVVRRFCPICATEDHALFGESYWHRAHLLPVTYICPKHRTPLLETSIPVKFIGQHVVYGLPDEIRGGTQNLPAPLQLLANLSNCSSALLTPDTHRSTNLISIYRSTAMAKGYGRSGNFIAGRQLAADLQTLYGPKLLTQADCTCHKFAWPALMVREKVSVPFAPVKHVLLQVFFDTIDDGLKNLEYRPPGRTPSNRTEQDSAFLKSIKAVLSPSPDTRYSIKDLLTEAGCWGAYRHNRRLFPKTAYFVHQFRHTSRSVKPIKN